MPTWRVGGYVVVVWTFEGRPVEPAHVHVSVGHPGAPGAKIWLDPVSVARPGPFSDAELRTILRHVRELHPELRRTYRAIHGR